MRTYNSEDIKTKRVYFTGTDTLQAGYALCYDRDSGTASADEEDRHTDVEKPTAANLWDFAGIVSPSDGGKTGPCWLSIMQPNGGVLHPHCDQNCTLGATRLTVKAASFALGGEGSGGPIVGMAIQTVNRSATNGIVEAVLYPLTRPREANHYSEFSRTAVQLPTAAIWNNFPLEDMRRNPFLGSLWETDFTRPVAPGLHTGQTALNSGDVFGDGATEMIKTYAGALGIGTCVMTAGTANKEIAWRPTCPIVASGAAGAVGKPWAFEVRTALGTITDGDYAGMFIGICESDYLLAGDELVDTTGAIIDKGLVGFNVLAGDGDAILRSYKNGGQAVQVTAAVKVPVAATYTTLGMYYDGVTIATYVDGVVNATGLITNAMIIEATPLFPQAEVLNPLLAFKELAAESNTLSFDWVRFAQAP